MVRQRIKRFAVLAAMVAMGLAVPAQAAMWNITFTGGDWSASGQIDVTGGVATSGYLDVTHGTTTIEYGYLATGSGIVQNNNGDNLPIGDNLVNTSGPMFFDQYGLLFVTSPINNGHTEAGMYLSANQNNGNVPNLNGYGNAPAGFGYDNPFVDGTVTLTAVPEPVTTTAFAGLSALGLLLVTMRSKFSSLVG